MSGGVDSTATAIMLKEKYSVTGFFMQLVQPDLSQQIDRVSEITQKLNIPLQIIDLRDDFEDAVLNYFCSSYFDGRTPNPCIICNKEVKFGLFLDAILKAGMTKVATGHYARVEKRKSTYYLTKGVDPLKDQSYFLSRLSQSQLRSILFPLGGITKHQIYDFVESHGFTSFRGEESQDVCFLKDSSVGEFIQNRDARVFKHGEIVDNSGKKLGRHSGIHNYTIGQRRGLGIPDSSPYYVINLDPLKNRVIVGKKDELYNDEITIRNCHWITDKQPSLTQDFQVKIRYTHRGSAARLIKITDSCYRLKFREPQKAITPGQYCVIYDGDEVVGSGEIS